MTTNRRYIDPHSDSIAASTKRVVRVPMPVPLIREMDAALVNGAGGYSTREEFIADAVRDKLVELEYEPAPPGPGETEHRTPPTLIPVPHNGERSAPASPSSLVAFDLEETVIHGLGRGSVLEGEALVQDVPLLGLHNRDYTSLWALAELANVLREAPQPINAALGAVTDRAWDFAGRVKPHDAGSELKLTALFPTNRSKPQSASGQFRAFAVGTVRESEGRLHGDGPLFVWRALQARSQADQIDIGLTEAGWDLLGVVDGISLRLPHSPQLAAKYFDYLRQHAPADFDGLLFAIRNAAERMTRAELIGAYQQKYSAWSEAQASTNAAGYVARGREWGLIEAKLLDRRYRLTTAGERMLADLG
jgi:hypothetical protein